MRPVTKIIIFLTALGLAGGTHRAAKHVGDPRVSARCNGPKCKLDIEAGQNTNFIKHAPRLQIGKCGLRASAPEVLDEDSAQAVLDRSQVREACDVRVIIDERTFTYRDVQF